MRLLSVGYGAMPPTHVALHTLFTQQFQSKSISYLSLVPFSILNFIPLPSFSGRTPKSHFFLSEIILPKKHKKKKGLKSLPEEDVAVSRNMFYHYD